MIKKFKKIYSMEIRVKVIDGSRYLELEIKEPKNEKEAIRLAKEEAAAKLGQPIENFEATILKVKED